MATVRKALQNLPELPDKTLSAAPPNCEYIHIWGSFMNRHSGFTLIELLIALGILGIIFAIAIPAYGSAMARAKMGEAESAIFTSINNATNFSFIGGTRAVLCPSTDGISCQNSFDWSKGWMVFEDKNANRERDSDDRVLASTGEISPELQILTSEGRTRIAFQSGGGNFGSNAHFKLCDARRPQRSRSLFLSNTGRVRVAESPQTACYR
jgi:type IV fimbrial biogenesis protein FimT